MTQQSASKDDDAPTHNNPRTPRPASVPVSLRSSTLQSLVRPGASLTGGNATQPSAATLQPNVTIKPTLQLAKPKSLLPEISRPLGSLAAAKAKAFSSKTSFSFAPNLNKSSQSKLSLNATPTATKTASPAGGMNVQDLLAHRLAVKNITVNPASFGRRPVFEAKVVSPLKSKMAQFEMMRRKRRKMKKSRDISELSWPPEDQPEDVTIYTPISLPYVMREDETDSSPGSHLTDGVTMNKLTDTGTETARKSQRPSVKKIDEANRNAASILFDDQADEDAANNWMLVQWPSILPALDRIAMEQQQENIELELLGEQERLVREQELAEQRLGHDSSRHIQKKYVPSLFSELPEGRLGKLLVRQSGRVQLAIGNHLFDVNAGSDCNFSQEAACYVEENSEFFFLGKCLKRMTVTPNVTLMINKVRNKS